MFYCVQQYLKHGVKVAPESLRSRRKFIISNYGNQFIEWYDNHIANHKDELYSIGDMYKAFLQMSNFRDSDFSSKRFSQAIEHCSLKLDYKLREGTRSKENLTRFKWVKK
jgi:hypothetical protein